MAVIYGSSQTDPRYANFRGSQTFAPRSVVGQKPLPFIGNTSNSGSSGVQVGSSNSSSSGDSGFTQSYIDAYNADLNKFNEAVDKYTNEVIAQSQGDYDFAAKWIESSFTEALGTDNQARAEFLKRVANDLEKKVGTIAFDEQSNTYRITSDRDLALKRLDQDEQIFKRNVQQEREQQGASLNARGLLSSTREDATGLAGKEVGDFETNANDRFLAYQRARENVNIESERSLEDNTTSARRLAQGAVDTRTYQTEQAKRLKEKNDALARATASAKKAENESYLKAQYFG